MRLGVWTPLPHTMAPEPRMTEAIADARQQGTGVGADKAREVAAPTLEAMYERMGFIRL